MNSPRTSVLTITRDRPKYLAEAIASVEAQTDQDLEHLVFNHGSVPVDPEVIGVLRAARARRPGQFFFANPIQAGPDHEGPDRPAYYWNVMVGFARGRYVAILDDDNRFRPEHVERMVAPMEADPGVGAVTCSWDYIDAEGQPAHGRPTCRRNLETSLRELYKDNTVDASALVVRRDVFDLVGGFSGISTNEDWEFVIRLARASEGGLFRVVHLPDVLLEYREHGGQRSRSAFAVGEYNANWPRIRREGFPGGRP